MILSVIKLRKTRKRWQNIEWKFLIYVEHPFVCLTGSAFIFQVANLVYKTSQNILLVVLFIGSVTSLWPLMSVVWLVGWSLRRSAMISWKGGKLHTLSCSYRSTCFRIKESWMNYRLILPNNDEWIRKWENYTNQKRYFYWRYLI